MVIHLFIIRYPVHSSICLFTYYFHDIWWTAWTICSKSSASAEI